MTTEVITRPATPVDKLKIALSTDSVKEQFRNALADSAPLFIASLIDLYGGDKYLRECSPSEVIMEALKAATLRLPINKSLGFAYVIPYKKTPTFQMGYKGYIQLAMRTGQYRYINAGAVHEGELIRHDKLTGELVLGEPTGEEVVGYFAFMETINGFRKTVYWAKEQVEAHAKRFSKTYNTGASPWKTDFDAMALKTMLRNLLSKYGIMSVEMTNALSYDSADSVDADFHVPDDKAKQLTRKINNESDEDSNTEPPAPACDNTLCDANNDGCCINGFVRDDEACKEYIGGATNDR